MPCRMRATRMPCRQRPWIARCRALHVLSVSTRTTKWAFERRDMKKSQLSIYLDRETFSSLEAFAKRRGKPKSLVAEAAIASFLSPHDSDRMEAAIAKRLDRIVRVLERLERNDGITLETIALFIRFWLTSTPALPEQSSPAARAKGAERYDRFVQALGRRLSSGSTILREVSLESIEVGNAAPDKGQAGSR